MVLRQSITNRNAASVVLFGYLLVSGTSVANAQITEFFGEDLNPNFTVPAGGNAETARDDFLATLSSNVGTEDFESISTGSF